MAQWVKLFTTEARPLEFSPKNQTSGLYTYAMKYVTAARASCTRMYMHTKHKYFSSLKMQMGLYFMTEQFPFRNFINLNKYFIFELLSKCQVMFTKNKLTNNFGNSYLTNSENKNLINGGQNISPVFHYYPFSKI